MKNVHTFLKMFSYVKQILNRQEKRTAILIALLSVFSAFLETLGVSAILPLVLALLKPDSLLQYDSIAKIVCLLNITDTSEMVVVVAIGVVLVFVVKNVFLFGFGCYKNRFTNRLEADLSIMMFNTYLQRPYSFFLRTNTSVVQRGVTSDVTAVSNSVSAYCTLFNEILTCIMLGIVLIIINPLMAIGICFLAAFITLTMVQVLRKKISTCGNDSRNAFIERERIILETFGGIKEILVMKRQRFFAKRFEEVSKDASNINANYQSYSLIPSRVTETTFITGLIVVVLISYFNTKDVSMLIAQFSALALAAVRILPSITNISNAMNSLVFFRSSLENAYSNIVGEGIHNRNIEFEICDEENKNHFEDQLFINDIYWKYSNEMDDVLRGVTLSIKRGEAIGFIGESGAGKTTLADVILGLFIPQAGTISVDGLNIYDENVAWHTIVGYVPQNVFLLNDSIKNNILFGMPNSQCDEARLKKTIEQAQLGKFIDSLPQGVDTVLGERGVNISGGQRQRIAIARALYYDPDILVLDEATSALDNDTENAVIESINSLQGNKTLIIIAHRLTTIANCDRIYEVADGKVVEKNKAEVLAVND